MEYAHEYAYTGYAYIGMGCNPYSSSCTCGHQCSVVRCAHCVAPLSNSTVIGDTDKRCEDLMTVKIVTNSTAVMISLWELS